MAVQAWIDIDYPPQAQYLVPFRRALEERGVEVLVTARDVGSTLALLRESGVSFTPVGASFGAAKWRKALGTLGRARQLIELSRRTGVPDLVVSTGRSASLAARLLGRPSFAVLDYEWVDLTIHRIARSVIFHPDVIDPSSFVNRGLDPRRLVPFPGLKEAISFHGLDPGQVAPHEFPEATGGLVKVLVRPPTEESHYYGSRSRELTLAALRHFSTMEDVLVILAPRHPWQANDLNRFGWRIKPVVLDKAVGFVSLLKAVDIVVVAGGTMLREAAYLGIPAYSLFQGKVGQVDSHLERIGRIEILSSHDDLSRIRVEHRPDLSLLPSKPDLLPAIVDEMLERSQVPGRTRARRAPA